MKESVAYSHLRRHWLPDHPGGLLQRVENAVGPGTPDVYACWRGISAWFESKVLEFPDGVWTLKKVERAQPPWWLDARRAQVPLFGALVHPTWKSPSFVTLDGLITLGTCGLTPNALRVHTITLDAVFSWGRAPYSHEAEGRWTPPTTHT